MQKEVEKVREITINALNKEITMEDMLEREEDQRELEEKKELEEQVKAEKEKEECLEKTIIEKKREEQLALDKQIKLDKIEKMKEDMRRQIQIKRESKLKEEAMKKKTSEIQTNQLKQQLFEMRQKRVNNYQHLLYIGKPEQCKVPAKDGRDNETVATYCGKNYVTDGTMLNKCKQNQEFCPMCCVKEIGDLHARERYLCLKKCTDQYNGIYNGENSEEAKQDCDKVNTPITALPIGESKTN
jgi:hypothetical protein